MPRLASALALCALVVAGCGGGGEGGTTRGGPSEAAPVHRRGQAQRSAQHVAA
jgi:hypothetical protein